MCLLCAVLNEKPKKEDSRHKEKQKYSTRNTRISVADAEIQREERVCSVSLVLSLSLYSAGEKSD
jgi:hypothetical protein